MILPCLSLEEISQSLFFFSIDIMCFFLVNVWAELVPLSVEETDYDLKLRKKRKLV